MLTKAVRRRASKKVESADEWSETKLGDLIDIEHGFAFKGSLIHDKPYGDVLLTPGNVAIGGGFKSDKFKYYNGHVSEEFVLREGDVFVTMTDLSKQSDTLGYPAFVPACKNGRRYLHNQRLGKIALKDADRIDRKYIYYVMCSAEYRREVLASATGTTVKHTSPDRIKQFRFLLAPLPEQRAITHILGTLDDKIELNRRMNETLEAMTRALFKSWFVDFDPVRAKMENRETELPQHLANLFPNRVVDSEIGEIPEGWVASNLGRHVEFQNGYAFKSDDWENSGIPVVKIGSVKPGLVDLTATSYVSSDTVIGLERFKLNPGDILVGMTGYPGETGLVPIHYPHPYLNQRVGRIAAPQSHPENYAWIYAQVRNQSFKKHAEARAHGSAQANISGRALLEYPVVFPEKALLEHYSDFATPLISRYIANDAESRVLATMRDALLPKLVSGEVRVSREKIFSKWSVGKYWYGKHE